MSTSKHHVRSVTFAIDSFLAVAEMIAGRDLRILEGKSRKRVPTLDPNFLEIRFEFELRPALKLRRLGEEVDGNQPEPPCLISSQGIIDLEFSQVRGRHTWTVSSMRFDLGKDTYSVRFLDYSISTSGREEAVVEIIHEEQVAEEPKWHNDRL